jgi:hypothetical protein
MAAVGVIYCESDECVGGPKDARAVRPYSVSGRFGDVSGVCE